MKKMTAFILAFAAAAALAACGKPAAPARTTAAPAQTTDAAAETKAPAAETGTEAAKAPGTAETKAAGSASSGTHVVTDHAGNEVEVPDRIDRIVVADIYPMASVLTVFFDSADKIVGMAPPCMSAAKNGLLGEIYPEILDAKTDFIDGTNINLEELMKLEPDVVFYSAGSKEEGELLRGAGIPALAISPGKWGYNAIETLDHWIGLLDELFPGNERAELVRAYSQQKYDLVQERVSKLSDEERANAFFLFQYSDTAILTSGQKFFGQWWCDAIGAKNVGHEMEKDNSVAVNMEQIYAWDPDLIFITNFNTASPEDLYGNTVGTYDWGPVNAVQNRRVYKMPLGMYRSYTCGVDTPVTLLWLAKTAYPDLFADVDITEETKAYYKDIFGLELTGEQANRIFAPVSDSGTGFVIKQ